MKATETTRRNIADVVGIQTAGEEKKQEWKKDAGRPRQKMAWQKILQCIDWQEWKNFQGQAESFHIWRILFLVEADPGFLNPLAVKFHNSLPGLWVTSFLALKHPPNCIKFKADYLLASFFFFFFLTPGERHALSDPCQIYIFAFLDCFEHIKHATLLDCSFDIGKRLFLEWSIREGLTNF